MTVGISLLLHQDFDCAAQLTRALLRDGCKIAVHIDANTSGEMAQPYVNEFSGHENLVLVDRIKCEWGRFSLVKAQLRAVESLLARFPKISHVVQLSGSCLPTRPIAELRRFLAENKGTDFIESVNAGQNNWIKGGLEAERFSLYFPFAWKRQRKRFDASVVLQRKLGVKRTPPAGLEPHIGSQWWTLSRETLKAIIDDPQRKIYDRFFKQSWIPDESYFQTLARKHAKRIESRSLTFSRFDSQGNPMLIYDDHLEYLEHLNGFFVRKVWNGANRLYAELLAPDFKANARDAEMRSTFMTQTEILESRRNRGRVGLQMQSKSTNKSKFLPETAAPYAVLVGFDKTFKHFATWLGPEINQPVQGDIFDIKAREIAQNPVLSAGNLSGLGRIRDHAPIKYLLNLVWNNRKSRLVFQFWSAKKNRFFNYMAADKNAHIHYIRGAWMLDLLHENITNTNVLREKISALLLLDAERIAKLESGNARFRVYSLNDALAEPEKLLHQLIADLTPSENPKPRLLPELRDAQGLENFITLLKNSGMNIDIELTHNNHPKWRDENAKPVLIAE